jgi:prepilin-type N-terminal cleavage/methylation domain-containing protein
VPSHGPQRGVTLIELLLAVAISAILLAGISGVVKLGLDAQTNGRTLNELAYQGRFALERMADKARLTVPKVLTTPAANTTGDWLAPPGCSGAACLMYCLNAGNQLIETTTADTTCVGTTTIANYVSGFTVAVPAAMGAVDQSIAVFGLTLSNGNTTATLTSSVRLGGGTL